jgi:hypothetical protein
MVQAVLQVLGSIPPPSNFTTQPPSSGVDKNIYLPDYSLEGLRELWNTTEKDWRRPLDEVRSYRY